MKAIIEKYRNKGLNCAESILEAGNEHYNLGLSETALKMVAGFGGGVKEGHLCGIVSGAVAVLSILFKDKELDNEDLLKITIEEFKTKFRSIYDEIDCDYIVDNYNQKKWVVTQSYTNQQNYYKIRLINTYSIHI